MLDALFSPKQLSLELAHAALHFLLLLFSVRVYLLLGLPVFYIVYVGTVSDSSGLVNLVKRLLLRFDDNLVQFLEDAVLLGETLLLPVCHFLLLGLLILDGLMPRSIVSWAVSSFPMRLFLLLDHYQILLDFPLEVAGDIGFLVIVRSICLFEKHRTYLCSSSATHSFFFLDGETVSWLSFKFLFERDVGALIRKGRCDFGQTLVDLFVSGRIAALLELFETGE